MRIVKIILLYLLFPIFLLVSGLIYFITTETGIRTIANVIPKLIPIVSIEGVRGNWENLEITQLRVMPQGVSVVVDDIALSINPSCLRSLNLCINQLTTSSVDVSVDTNALPETDPTPLQPIKLPLEIYLDKLDLKNLSIRIDDVQMNLESLNGNAIWRDTLSVKELSLSQMIVNLPKKLIDDTLEKNEVTYAADTNIPIEDQITQIQEFLNSPLLAELPSVLIPIDLDIQKFNLNQLKLIQASQTTQVENFSLNMATQGEKVIINELKTGMSFCNYEINTQALCLFAHINGNGHIDMKNKWPILFSLQVNSLKDDGLFALQGVNVNDTSLELSLSGNVNDEINTVFHIKRLDEMLIAADANLNISVVPLEFNIMVDSENLAWPMHDLLSIDQDKLQFNNLEESEHITDAQMIKEKQYIPKNTYSVSKFKLIAKGSSDEFSLDLSSGISLPELNTSQINLNIKGNPKIIEIDNFSIMQQADNAELPLSAELLKLEGKLNLDKGLSWDVTLDSNNISYLDKVKDLNTMVSGNLSIIGSLNSKFWDIVINDIDLDGSINGHTLSLAGSFSGNSNHIWEVEKLVANLGDNTFSLSGLLANEVNLDLTVNAPKLQGILPELSGSIVGNSTVRGSLSQPDVFADMEIRQFRFGDISVKNATLKSTIETDQIISGDLSLDGSGINVSNASFTTLALKINGDEKNHSITLNAAGKPISSVIKIDGSFNRDTLIWQASISHSNFTTSEGPINLEQPFKVQLSPDLINVAQHCWVHEAGRLCLLEPFELKEESRLLLGLDKVNLTFLNRYLGEGTQLNGGVKGQLDLLIFPNRNIRGELTLDGEAVNVQQFTDNAWLKAEFETFRLKSNIENDEIVFDWLFALKNNGSLNGVLSINDITGARSLTGKMGINQLNLNLLQPLFGQNEVISGAINSQLNFSGNIDKPLVNGEFNLDDLKVVSYRIPFDIIDSNLNILFTGQQSVMTGEIITPDGAISLNGQANWQNTANWQTVLNASSTKLKVTVPPMAEIELQPNITFEANKNKMLLTGNVDIPWGRIVVDALPEAVVEVSSDQVFLDTNMQPIEQSTNSLPIEANLMINLGNDIQLNAFGLIANLTGHLNVIQSEQGTSIFGEVTTPTGRFRAYGQDLILRKGVITFAGTADRPRLNVEAIRNPQNIENDVVAGVRVSGYADDPRIELFSIPAMAQEEILSYILRGQGLDVAGADSGLMTSMLIGLGTAQSGQLIGTIGETFGVKNLTLDTQGTGDSSQVVVSGDIFPGLQVRYGVGIFDSLATITLRYQLMPRLYLEAVSGLDQAIDLLYQFEFN
ncbi:autotransporter assembly complex protein TamB [Thorsellia anophelis]|uniref:Autotransporter secretion inner membrane protein TamB n=1 Tax=Thorsellia anophelis DSM 18579 TaxID=1123402 RepID=A0A1H9ZNZ2_9GAMM|nr:translocation/assembly module TamB domain-containing protein [Thorsellia anophelis]SES83355.1 autotransporter secretion inner membrane protein TamB [Thorsellia anophelis DSM 18579]